MADINNSLALGIKNDPIDIGKILGEAAQINSLRASTAQTEQETRYRQFQQDQNGGYRVPDVSTMTEVAQKRNTLRGEMANILYNNPKNVQGTFKAAEDSGVPLNDMEKQTLLRMSPQQRQQWAQDHRNASMPAAQNMEMTGEVTANQGGQLPQPIEPNVPYTNRTSAANGGQPRARPTNAIKQMTETIVPNADGSLPSVPKQPTTGPTGPTVVRNPDGSISSSVTPETLKTQESYGEDYVGYKDAAKKAAITKYTLHNMSDDADRLSTGKGATFSNTAKQWLQSAQKLPGVGSIVKSITGDISDPIAAFEALQKNAGQLTRATLQDVDGKAASEYRMIQSQLPNVEMSPRGLKLVTAQMMAPEDFKQSKLQAADRWKAANHGSLGGFEADWNKNITPSTFLFARLPASDRDALIKNLQKTDTGRAQLDNIKRQSKWAHDHGLDEFID